MRRTLLCLPLVLALGCNREQTTHAADHTTRAPDSTSRAPENNSRAADNSAQNARDRSGATLTPMDQSESPSDLALTQAVRKCLVDDSEFSTSAKNIKVISRDGKVTLRGVVASQEEKDEVIARVKALPEVHDCDVQLEVKTN